MRTLLHQRKNDKMEKNFGISKNSLFYEIIENNKIIFYHSCVEKCVFKVEKVSPLFRYLFYY